MPCEFQSALLSDLTARLVTQQTQQAFVGHDEYLIIVRSRAPALVGNLPPIARVGRPFVLAALPSPLLTSEEQALAGARAAVGYGGRAPRCSNLTFQGASRCGGGGGAGVDRRPRPGRACLNPEKGTARRARRESGVEGL